MSRHSEIHSYSEALIAANSPKSSKSLASSSHVWKCEVEGFSSSPLATLTVGLNSQLTSLSELTEKYRNSMMMHPDVPDSMKPVLLFRSWERPFPSPTHALHRPPWVSRRQRE